MNRKFFKINNCKRYQDLIQKRLDGEITPEENRELDDHLADCPQCLDELTSFAAVQDLLIDALDNPVEVPEELFENLADELEEIKPARGLHALLAHPFFTTYRNIALAATSLVLVAVLTLSVGAGAFGKYSHEAPEQLSPADSQALILTNCGDAIVLSGDEGDPDRYSAALDDLERAYREALGQETGKDTEGYIHTSWHDGESATPIR